MTFYIHTYKPNCIIGFVHWTTVKLTTECENTDWHMTSFNNGMIT